MTLAASITYSFTDDEGRVVNRTEDVVAGTVTDTDPTSGEVVAVHPMDPARLQFVQDARAAAVARMAAEASAEQDRIAAQAAREAAVQAVRESLTTAAQLIALSPLPTPEEQAVIDAQVADAKASYRALTDPPLDVQALAVAVLTLEV